MTPPQPIGFTAHRCDEFQLGIPWRVALQQSPPPLPRPYSACNRGFRSPRKSQRTAHRDFSPCLTPGGHSILSSTFLANTTLNSNELLKIERKIVGIVNRSNLINWI